MNILNMIQLVLLLVTGIGVSITDLRKGKIKNKNLFIALVIGVLINLLIYNGKTYLLKTYFGNVVSVCAVSIGLYALRIWAGGDSKFLILIALLYPTEMCWELNDSRMTLWIILVFTFITGYVYLIIDTVRYYVLKKQKFNVTCLRLKEVLNNYFSAVVFLAALSHIYMYFLFPHLQIDNVIYAGICVAYIWWISSKGVLKNWKITICVIIFDIIMAVITGYIPINTEWKTYVIVIISMILKVILEKYNYEEIETKDVKVGMILSQITTLYFQQSKIKGLPQISDETLRSRLTSDEVESVKKWGMSKGGKEKLVIVRKIPFAIFITFGMFIYVILGGILKCY